MYAMVESLHVATYNTERVEQITVRREREQHLSELREGVEEVEDLRNEKQQQGLAEMAQNPHHRKRHSSEVTVRVANESLGRIPEGVNNARGIFHTIVA